MSRHNSFTSSCTDDTSLAYVYDSAQKRLINVERKPIVNNNHFWWFCTCCWPTEISIGNCINYIYKFIALQYCSLACIKLWLLMEFLVVCMALCLCFSVKIINFDVLDFGFHLCMCEKESRFFMPMRRSRRSAFSRDLIKASFFATKKLNNHRSSSVTFIKPNQNLNSARYNKELIQDVNIHDCCFFLSNLGSGWVKSKPTCTQFIIHLSFDMSLIRTSSCARELIFQLSMALSVKLENHFISHTLV